MTNDNTLSPISYLGMTNVLRALFGSWDYKPYVLLGKPLRSVEVTDNNEKLVFTLEDGRTVTFETDSECCSYTWIEHLTVPPDIAGASVTGGSEQGMGEFEGKDENGKSTGEDIKVYQTSFETARGEIVVEYRNSSNGYYGGSLRGPIEDWAMEEAKRVEAEFKAAEAARKVSE